MAQVIATTQIVRNVSPGRSGDKDKGIRAVAPVNRVIEKGTLFVSEGEELEQLRKAKAVRDPQESDQVKARPSAMLDDAPVRQPKASNGGGGRKTSPSKPAKADSDDANDGDDSGKSLV